MQSEPIILIPPTHEQSTPSFHVEGSLAGPFITFLAGKGVRAWQPPERLEIQGPDDRYIIEIEIEANTSPKYLEGLIDEFLFQGKST